MNGPTIRRTGVAAACLLATFIFGQSSFGQDKDKKQEGKPSGRSKSQPGNKSQPAKPPVQNSERNFENGNRGESGNRGGNNRGPNPSVQANRGNVSGRSGGYSRPLPQGSRQVQTQTGASVTMRSNNRPAVVHASNGVEVRHGYSGRTEVVRESSDRTRVVAVHSGFGYVQHPYVYGGHPYVARTYVMGGRSYQTFYRGYPYRGVYLEVYAPVRYYPSGFYGWAGNPWAAPVTYSWGWTGTPWFRFYGGYFTPYPVYASPALWLTDYMIAESLNAAYQAQFDAPAGGYLPPPPEGQVGLSPDVKQAIADEVQRQIAIENGEAQSNAQGVEPDPASSGIAAMLSDGRTHTFVVGDGLDLINGAGQECAMTEGDVLQLAGPPPPDADSATMIVLASKGGLECRQGGSVTVALEELQDMQNHMRRVLDAGLSDLQAHQNGLPAAPQPYLTAAASATFTTGAPPPDASAGAEISQQIQQGAQAEREALNDLGSGPAAAAAAPRIPPTISLGQSTDQVIAILGQPAQVVDLGARKIYVYPNLKVTFNDGAVTDVQ